MAYIFQKLAKQGYKTGLVSNKDIIDSREWFRDQAQNIKIVNTTSMMKTGVSGSPSMGSMYMFMYDPKNKSTLPYYDKFPLVFPINFYSDGFLGINLHYIPPEIRAVLMDRLYSTINNDSISENTKVQLNYEMLTGASRFKYFKPCVKRYLYSHVVSGFKYVSPLDWDKAIMLPTERFVKSTKERAWSDSMSKL
jgi:hypothetical protein